jgi:peptidoglycan/xylan/chitin deacetylase (PgdA/CDA1 family)
MTWGLSFDDGPSPYTSDLVNYLGANNLKSTFFIVGSRAISRPDILQAEYMAGHQLSVHTWSHPSLTTLSNEQIIAELGWTMKAIKDITGVTPNTMRPPYGDMDDRVRAICKAMGLTPIIWTSNGQQSFDTDDWHIAAGTVSSQQVLANFNGILNLAPNLNTGFIVLSHDLYQQSVDLAIGYYLPDALARNPPFKLEPIITCLNKPLGFAYSETNNNQTNPPTMGATTLSANPTGGSGGGNGAMGLSPTKSLIGVAVGLVASFIGASLVV